ncbi:hypothetical protein [Halobacterium rubrum]|uniref:hypothetical protein n=1 Tax=Halobacterium TaxID=2239 RepID=UPI001F47470C|nr:MULTISPECIES: hypothetical protein [Halobacterium]MDH5020385.1 hypothetical protein [Halobacterium rubrum]
MSGRYPEDHFIDTNILIGYTVEWDNQRDPVSEYTSANPYAEAAIHTSEAVLDEAEDVVNKQRRLAKQAARKVFEDCDTDGGVNAEQDIIDFIRSEFDDDSIRGVLRLVSHIPNLYIGLSQSDNTRALSANVGDIDECFEDPTDFVRALRDESQRPIDLNVFRDRPSSYSQQYEPEYRDLDNLIENKADRDILLDSYRLADTDGIEEIAFISTDEGDILSNDTGIESSLTVVSVFHPQALT